MTTFGNLERIDPDTCWQGEAGSFQAWLAEEQNLDLLARALKVPQLVVEDADGVTGPYRADLLCRETGSAQLVLIESQLTASDHAGFGQLISYAAALDAGVVVWLSIGFLDEHRAALEWLNRMTGEDLHFFGVRVELWRIGDSVPAPRFDVVVRPNGWLKRVRAATRQIGNTDRAEAYRSQWDELEAFLADRGSAAKLFNIGGRHWGNAEVGASRTAVVISYSIPHERARIYLLFRDADSLDATEDARAWFRFGRAHAKRLGLSEGECTWVADDEPGYLRIEASIADRAALCGWFAERLELLASHLPGLEARFDTGTQSGSSAT